MRNLFITFLLISALIFSSCNEKKPSQVNAMADELCKTMAILNPDDTATFKPVYEGIVKISQNENYNDVTVVELDSVMNEKCPEGLKLYKIIVQIGKDTTVNEKDSVQ